MSSSQSSRPFASSPLLRYQHQPSSERNPIVLDDSEDDQFFDPSSPLWPDLPGSTAPATAPADGSDSEVDPDIDGEMERILEERRAVETRAEDSLITAQTVLLTNGCKNPLRTRFTELVTTFPEYPRTNPLGYTYVVNIEDWASKPATPAELDVQYCWKRRYQPYATTSQYFGNAKFWRHEYQCTGIKACEHLSNELRNLVHEDADENVFKTIIAGKDALKRVQDTSNFRATKAYYDAVQKKFERGFCHDKGDACSLYACQSEEKGPDGFCVNYVGCKLAFDEINGIDSISTQTRSEHYCQVVRSDMGINYNWLCQMIHNKGNFNPKGIEKCAQIESTLTRRKHCGIDHAQGQGAMGAQTCSIMFSFMFPIDLSSPYVVLVSTRKHTHAPPPPTKTPAQIANDICKLIDAAKSPTLTAARFEVSWPLQAYLYEKGVRTLAQLHPSLINQDVTRSLLAKRRMTWYPEGQQLNGLLLEYDRHHRYSPNRAYIQSIELHPEHGLMIVCMTREQAHMWLDRKDWEVDMSFKRVRQRGLNEVMVAAYDADLGKIATYCRIFMSAQSALAYEYMFGICFKHVERLTKRKVKWRYMEPDNEGWQAVISDMDQGQYQGASYVVANAFVTDLNEDLACIYASKHQALTQLGKGTLLGSFCSATYTSDVVYESFSVLRTKIQHYKCVWKQFLPFLVANTENT